MNLLLPVTALDSPWHKKWHQIALGVWFGGELELLVGREAQLVRQPITKLKPNQGGISFNTSLLQAWQTYKSNRTKHPQRNPTDPQR